MSKKMQALEEFLSQLFIIEPQIKDGLRENFLEFSEEKQNKVLFVLEKSLEKQNGFVEKALKKNPNLMKDIEHDVAKVVKKTREEEENKSDQEEIKLLLSLEETLKQL